MLMATAAAYMHTDSSHSGSSTITPAPWHLAAVPVATQQQQHQQVVLFDQRDLVAAPSPSSPPRPRNNNNNHHQQLRPAAARRPSSTSRRRRPRPSRKMPTTYITADPISFRRMVHQVTGAENLPRPPLTHEATTLCRPAPTRVVAAAGALPTLDTSALQLGIGAGSGSARRTTTGPAAASEVDVGGGGVVGVGFGGTGGYGGGGSDCGAGYDGFPTLESWDALLY